MNSLEAAVGGNGLQFNAGRAGQLNCGSKVTTEYLVIRDYSRDMRGIPEGVKKRRGPWIDGSSTSKGRRGYRMSWNVFV